MTVSDGSRGLSGMDELGLFTAALGLCGPWRVTRSEVEHHVLRGQDYISLFATLSEAVGAVRRAEVTTPPGWATARARRWREDGALRA